MNQVLLSNSCSCAAEEAHSKGAIASNDVEGWAGTGTATRQRSNASACSCPGNLQQLKISGMSRYTLAKYLAVCVAFGTNLD